MTYVPMSESPTRLDELRAHRAVVLFRDVANSASVHWSNGDSSDEQV